MKILNSPRNKKRILILFLLINSLLLVIGIQNKITIIEGWWNPIKSIKKLGKAIGKASRKIYEISTNVLKNLYGPIDALVKLTHKLKDFFIRAGHWMLLVGKMVLFGAWALIKVPSLLEKFYSIPNILPGFIVDSFVSLYKLLISLISNFFNTGKSEVSKLSSSSMIDNVIGLPSRVFEIMLCPIIYIMKDIMGVPLNIDYFNNKCYGNQSIYSVFDNISSDINSTMNSIYNIF
jgi:hypothetical protein